MTHEKEDREEREEREAPEKLGFFEMLRRSAQQTSSG